MVQKHSVSEKGMLGNRMSIAMISVDAADEILNKIMQANEFNGGKKSCTGLTVLHPIIYTLMM